MKKSIDFNKTFAIRSVICFVLCLSLAAVAIFRIISINISVKEKTANTPINSVSFNYGNTRGNIYDCYGFLLTNEKEEYLSVITPSINAIKRINSIFTLEERQSILERLKNNKPILQKTNTLINNDGIYSFSYTQRYTNNSLAKHLIGYINLENNGVFGIEKSYNDILYSNENFSVSVATNAKGEAIKNTELEFYGKQNKNAVYLTIDKRIQAIAENMSSPLNKGVIIIAETKTGEIKALVSKPNFDQNNIAASLNDENSPLLNRALLCYNVGSVFKPCVAVAAIKCGLENYQYTCNGKCVIDGYTFNCHKNSGHGLLNLKTAIANSCNTYFYNLAQNIDKEILYNTAVSFGFASSETIANNLKTNMCNICELSELQLSKRLVANFSIGQGNLLISPISMLNLYNAIANNGSYIKPYVVKKSVSNNKANETESYCVNAFSSKEATIIKESLLEVIESGTGKAAKSKEILLAGKTATAETGWKIDGNMAVHSWFCGFFPYYNPKYTVVIFAENSDITDSSCTEIFKNIAENLKNAGLTT